MRAQDRTSIFSLEQVVLKIHYALSYERLSRSALFTVIKTNRERFVRFLRGSALYIPDIMHLKFILPKTAPYFPWLQEILKCFFLTNPYVWHSRGVRSGLEFSKNKLIFFCSAPLCTAPSLTASKRHGLIYFMLRLWIIKTSVFEHDCEKAQCGLCRLIAKWAPAYLLRSATKISTSKIGRLFIQSILYCIKNIVFGL